MPQPPERPDPDALLARVQQQETAAVRGKLKIYFGSSAGVGKTYAMLSAAHRAVAEGRDVVVGLVETHGREETAALTDNLEHLPLRQLTYRERVFQEFDIDAALARCPNLLLVDELAHSNIEGSRHPKRWQDVEELLAAGIDVWTTLNVQHLESLNDVVGGIAGILVSETVPDRVFDAADEVVLVDLPADELLLRLKAGKIYLPQQAERAASSFFRKGNLIALREIALRRTADRVEGDVLAYRIEKSINSVWKTDNAILACISSSEGAERVVRSAAQLARQINTSWHAVYVETPARQHIIAQQRESMLNVLKLAEQLQAKTAVLTGENIAQTLVRYARLHNLSCIVVGCDTSSRRWPWQQRVGDAIAAIAPDLDVLRIGKAEKDNAQRKTHSAVTTNITQSTGWTRYAWTTGLCLLATLLATPLANIFDLANIVMLFLLTVLMVSMRFGRGPSVYASILNVFLFDFFFVQPKLSFSVSDVQYLFTFGVMLAVGLITGQLTARLRFQARISAQREERAHMLFEFARDLSGALQTEQIVDIGVNTLQRIFGGSAALLLPNLDEQLQVPQPAGHCLDVDRAIAQWAFDKNEQAGFATDTLPASEYRYIPLRAPVRIRGILAIKPENKQWLLIPEQQRQLETLASLIAIALERVHFVEIAQDMLVRMESERLRNSLLAAISHDLRTPLTAVVGFADALTLKGLPEKQQQDMIQAIHESATRMHTLVNNLLDMARIESGEIRLNKDWYSLEEIVGSAIRSLQPILNPYQVRTDIPLDLPLIACDAVLIERVLANLLENASKYTPPQSTIEISAQTAPNNSLMVTVSDNGSGLPAGQEQYLFEKFTRGKIESTINGFGLGLAICKAIVEAHGGDITARNRENGSGAVFEFTLPLSNQPSFDSEPDGKAS